MISRKILCPKCGRFVRAKDVERGKYIKHARCRKCFQKPNV